MDERIFELFDTWAGTVAADLSIAAAALDGLYSRHYQADPSIRGLNRYMQVSGEIPDAAARLANDGISKFEDASAFYRTAFNPDAPGSPETRSIAIQQLRAHFESLRLLAARRFKAALVSRSSLAPPSAGSLRVMNRAGQSVDARQMFFLITRKALIDVFNEAQIDGLAASGEKVAQVYHRDPNHETHGAQILVDARLTGLPSYMDVQEKWFHPRSNAVIGRSN